MIHELFLTTKATLKANGVPFECVYGPQPVPDKVGGTRIEFQRDTTAGDQMHPPRSQMVNPRQYAVRAMGVLIRIFARATLAGAQRHDHERVAEKLADQVYIGLYKAVRAAKTMMRVVRAGFVSDSPDTPDNWSGVVYELRVQVDRGVHDLTWTDDAAAEATLSATSGATSLDLDGPGVSTSLPNATTRMS